MTALGGMHDTLSLLAVFLMLLFGGTLGDQTHHAAFGAHNVTNITGIMADHNGSASFVPFLLTRLAGNWMNSTYTCMRDFYANASSSTDGAQDSHEQVMDFIGKMASGMIEEVVQPGADLCLSS